MRRCASANAFISDCAIQRLASYTSRRMATVCIIGKMPVSRKYACSTALKSGNRRRTLPPGANVEGMRAVCSASISPLASIAESVCVGPIDRISMPGGRSSLSFSVRPGSSSPPVKYVTLSTGTP
jgi:hypothetical protein